MKEEKELIAEMEAKHAIWWASLTQEQRECLSPREASALGFYAGGAAAVEIIRRMGW